MDQLFELFINFFENFTNSERRNANIQLKSIIDNTKEINEEVWLVALYYKNTDIYVALEGVAEGRRVIYINPVIQLDLKKILNTHITFENIIFDFRTIAADELKYITNGYTCNSLLITESNLKELCDKKNKGFIANWVKPILVNFIYAQLPFFIQLDLCNKMIEKTLSLCAIFPIVGTIPALLKASLGVLQMALSVVSLIFSLPLLAFDFGKEMSFLSVRQIIRGFDNFITGLVLSVPVLGPLLFLMIIDKNRDIYEPNQKAPIVQLSEFKLFPCTEINIPDPYEMIDKFDSNPKFSS